MENSDMELVGLRVSLEPALLPRKLRGVQLRVDAEDGRKMAEAGLSGPTPAVVRFARRRGRTLGVIWGGTAGGRGTRRTSWRECESSLLRRPKISERLRECLLVAEVGVG